MSSATEPLTVSERAIERINDAAVAAFRALGMNARPEQYERIAAARDTAIAPYLVKERAS